MAEQLLMELKSKRPKMWMMVTNGEGALVHRSLVKMCKAEGLSQGENDDTVLLRALLEAHGKGSNPGGYSKKGSDVPGSSLDEAFLEGEFKALCTLHGASELSFDQCMSWDWIAHQVGVTITKDATGQIWRRVVGTREAACETDFVALARALQAESETATTIQSFMRGCAGRVKAHSQAREAAETAQKSRCSAEMKLAPYNPTPSCAVRQALDALSVGPEDVLYDLGCGDGRLLIAAAQRGAKAVGVEYDARFVEKADGAIRQLELSNFATVMCGDAFATDLVPASKIFVYLVPDGLRKLEPSLNAALKLGTPIASYMFSIPGWSPDEVLTAETRSSECKVWIYKTASCLAK